MPTDWNLEIDRNTSRRLGAGDQYALVRYDKGNDFQRGDTVNFGGEGEWLRYRGPWTVTHVIKNQNGVAHEYAVLCVKPADAGYWEGEARLARAASDRLRGSNAALRGVITRMRKASKR